MGLKVVKEKIPVVILTNNYRVEGEMHLVPGGRLIDEINKKDRNFLPVTNVTIYDVKGDSPLDTLDFLAINKELVVFVTPLMEL